MVIGPPAAQSTEHWPAHIVRIRLGISYAQSLGTHQLTRRTESTLWPIVFDERLLQWIECSVLRQPLDCLHGPAVGPHGQIAARVDRLAVQQDRAGAALPTITTDLRASHAEVVAKNFNERPAIFYFDAARGAVHRNAYGC